MRGRSRYVFWSLLLLWAGMKAEWLTPAEPQAFALALAAALVLGLAPEAKP